MSGPRIYHVPTTLAGPIADWRKLVRRAAAMRFDWIALTPFTAEHAAEPAFARFVERAGRAGLRVMTELAAGTDPRAAALRDLALGVRGFRCAAALRLPAGAWRAAIEAAHLVAPDALFVADALGAPPDAVATLRDAGFGALLNSAKWWNARDRWFIEQYDRFRHIAPTIAFPESLDGPRLASETGDTEPDALARLYRFRYALAAFVSSGVLMPMGYEYGWSVRADAARPAPEPERKRFDLSAFVAEVNAAKAALPALNEEGPQQQLVHEGRTYGLLRRTDDGCAEALALFAPTEAPHPLALPAPAAIRAARPAPLVERGVPHANPVGDTLRLEPGELRLFATALPHAPPLRGRGRREAARPCIVENVTPRSDGGRFPVKTIAGERFVVEADAFREGHLRIAAALLAREREGAWTESPLLELGNDRWRGSFVPARNGRYEYAVEAWPDAYASWYHDARVKRSAGQAIGVELLEGRALIAEARERADATRRGAFDAVLTAFDGADEDDVRADLLLADAVVALVASAPDRSRATRSPVFPLVADRPAARTGAWYELFPRSQGPRPGVHGTLRDAARALPRVRALGFDVVYLPPIHPIGHAFRKGRGNAPEAGPHDPGSPWAIGNVHGGHTAIEPRLGTFEDFDHFVKSARALGLEVALDYALQCSPDHPWLREHPEWFTFRPDGTIKYAENPPKKYQDIVNFNWDGPHAQALWKELRDVVLFWVRRGVRIFRVDNPHTKPFAFWEWMIADVQGRRPDVIFLAEAFTRPKVMLQLAKLGFTQSYTYFTWRDTPEELASYLTELVRPPYADVYRPNFFANTPDILPPFLQSGGRAAFLIRLYLAATLSSSYGIYSGYEVLEADAVPGSEEYARSEKYELRFRDWNAPGNISAEIRQINRIRRDNPALHDWRNLRFLDAGNGDVLYYMKSRAANTLLVAVNLNPFRGAQATMHVPLDALGIGPNEPYGVENLLTGDRFTWRGDRAGWWFDPGVNPAAIFRIDARTPPAVEVPG